MVNIEWDKWPSIVNHLKRGNFDTALGAEEKAPFTKSHDIACGRLQMCTGMEEVLERHVC